MLTEPRQETIARDDGTGDVGRLAVAISVSAAMLAALCLRSAMLWIRGVVDYDETYYYILGRHLVTGKGYVLNGLPHTAFPPLYPLLVGVVTLFTDNMRLATSLVTAISGALLPLPVYFLGKEVFGRRAGIFAAWFVAVWPALSLFAAGHLAYEERMYYGSEGLYATLVACGLLFLWRLGRAGGWANALLGGLFFGLASLVRSEGPVVFGFVFIWLLFELAWRRVLLRPAALLHAALCAAVVLSVMSPFLVYVRNVTGAWSLGAKLDNNVRIRDTLWDWTRNHEVQGFYNTHYRLSDDNTHMEDPYWGVTRWHRAQQSTESGWTSGVRMVLSPDWRWLPYFFKIFVAEPRPLVPYVVWLAAFLGIALSRPADCRPHWWLFLAANVLAMLFLAVSLYVLPRHELPLLPLVAVVAGAGLEAVSVVASRLLARFQRPARAVLAVVPAAGVLAALAFTAVVDNLPPAKAYRKPGGVADQGPDMEIAAWLKANLPPGAVLMCHEPWIPVWAGLEWRVKPAASPARVAEYALNAKIDFALLTPWQWQKWPDEMPALEKYLVKTFDPKSARLYDFRSARAAPSPDGESADSERE